MLKTCCTCRRRRRWTSFALNPNSSDGHASQCRECKRAYDQRRYPKIKARMIRYVAEWQKANPEKVRAYRAKLGK